ncbi:ABC transporter ATP-binding protein [Intestinimonas butyriciproducens]|uniref:ABC transporter ATP-binding protein n=1 Tax=Intestinimonas butyriciproducens TaxID=1297617 RepID=UPI001957F982|nr:ABC transporter ATP-binding protein [Intestinimonas butyriciproducens]MBM6975710.1 ABC transporter ATP-binding protein [Intestinimonas butyriciproducens]
MFHSIKRLLHWAGGYRKRLYLGCLCSFFSVWCTAIPIVIAAWTLGLVIADFRGENSLEWNIIWLSLVGIVISIFLRYIFSYWKAKLQESIGYEIAAEERLKIGNVLKRVSLGYFSKNSTGDILTAITGDLSSLELQGMKLIDAIVNGYINLLAIVIILLIVCPMAALTSLVGAILSALALNGISKKSRKNAPTKQISQERITDASLEYIHGLPIVKSFGQEGASIEEWKTACEKHKDINLKIMHGFVPNNCLHLLALKIASVLLILISGIFTIQGNLTISIFLLIAMFAFMIFGAVENMNDSVHMLGLIDTSMDKLENIENAEFIDEAGRDFSIASYNIDFTDVFFGYGEIEVLHNLSFQIPQNTTTAIVGPSGSGKSTICNLITRFYDVNSGSVKIGGHDVREFTCDSLLKNISMVFQNVYLFRDTIKNNIKFGSPDATDEQIIAAAKAARCHDFIMALPDGYDTVIGEGGSSLSGGEKQRISIARAMLKDAPIVILDEATASIDPENEHLIQEAISALTHGKTIITIAHRLATIENADQILVIDGGTVAQRGTHKELLQQEGTYKKFIQIREQAEGWRIQ